MPGYRLLAIKGWGSVIVEMAAAIAGIALEREEIDFKGAGRDRLLKLNPLAQIPTLLLADGTVMTESAAIILYLSELKPGAGLAPAPGDGERAIFLRWLVFLVAAIYPTFTIADDPTRLVSGAASQAELKERAQAHRQALWRQVEKEVQGPWFLGSLFSALDLYLAAMTRWGPGRDWFRVHAPKLYAIALAAEALPAVAPVIDANFG